MNNNDGVLNGGGDYCVNCICSSVFVKRFTEWKISSCLNHDVVLKSGTPLQAKQWKLQSTKARSAPLTFALLKLREANRSCGAQIFDSSLVNVIFCNVFISLGCSTLGISTLLHVDRRSHLLTEIRAFYCRRAGSLKRETSESLSFTLQYTSGINLTGSKVSWLPYWTISPALQLYWGVG